MDVITLTPVTAPAPAHLLPDHAQLSLFRTPAACGHDHIKRPAELVHGGTRRGGGPLTQPSAVPVVQPPLL